MGRLRRRRTIGTSSPSTLALSPADSGYHSTESSSPERPESVGDLPWSFDGHSSTDEDSSGQDEGIFNGGDVSEPDVSTICQRTPLPSTKSDLSVPSSFFSGGKHVQNGLTKDQTIPGRGRSLRMPDRFVPVREHASQLSDVFRTTKPVDELSPAEKLLRSNVATPDAFCFRLRAVVPMASDFRLLSQESSPGRSIIGAVLGSPPQRNSGRAERQASHGTIWTVGGVAPSSSAVDDSRGRLVRSGTNAQLFTTSFSISKPKVEEELEKHDGRVASALNIDRVRRILHFDPFLTFSMRTCKKGMRQSLEELKTAWNGTEWVKHGLHRRARTMVLPTSPFKVLDAPGLRDDFYCSVLAYSSVCRTLVIGLGNILHGWTEQLGAVVLNQGSLIQGVYLTSVAFSSDPGHKSILAFGRSSGELGLMSLYDSMIPRFDIRLPVPVACIRWRPVCTQRPSRNPHTPGVSVDTEDLLVGDDYGNVRYYIVEWPLSWEVERDNWPGRLTLVSIITVHSQQICGLAWSPGGQFFATGGNDNCCNLFDVNKVLGEEARGFASSQRLTRRTRSRSEPGRYSDFISRAGEELARLERSLAAFDPSPTPTIRILRNGSEKHRWVHGAAVKAIAFCPWREGLIATGGGSSDKCIHFFHTTSGAALATIAVSAQVTSLIWSGTRREIAATFGYAQPDHPYRIAIFSWPDCRQVAAIPWEGEHRALYAIPFPGGPREKVKRGEGCVVVAASNESVRFHEVWGAEGRATASGAGMLGGSDILEGLEGIDKEGDIIR